MVKQEILPSTVNQNFQELFSSDRQQWTARWQDRKFVSGFPDLARESFSTEMPNIYTQQDRESAFELAFSTFMEAFGTNSIAVDPGIRINPDGTAGRSGGKNNPIIHSQSTDSPLNKNIATLLVFGFSLKDQQSARDIITRAYQELKPDKKKNFTSLLIRLITKNNLSRLWINQNGLDAKNGFEWDAQTTKLELHLANLGHKMEKSNEFPDALRINPQTVSEETVDVLLDFILEHLDKLRKFKLLSKFLFDVKELQNPLFEEKMAKILDKP